LESLNQNGHVLFFFFFIFISVYESVSLHIFLDI